MAETRFADVLEIRNGRNQSEVEAQDGAYPIYGSGGIMGRANSFICPANTVVIGRKGSINKPIFVEEPFWNVDTAFGLVADKTKLLPRYLYYFCVYYDFEKLNTTVTIPSLTKANLLKIEINLPDLSTQHCIVETLNQIEHIIQARQRQLRTLDTLIKARFVEMFGDPELNPKGWEKGAIKDYADILVGYPFPSEGYSEEGIDIVGGYNLMQGYIQWDDSKHWPNETGYEQYLLQANDIVMAMDRPWVNGGFKIAPVEASHLPALLIQRTACIRGNGLRQEFLHILLDSQRFAEHCNITGSLVPHISSKDINSFQVILPPMELQNEFVAFVAQVDKSKAAVQQALEKAQLLFDSLMQTYFG